MTTLAELRAQNAAEEKRLAAKTPENEDTIAGDVILAGEDTVVADDTIKGADEDTLEGADTQEGGDTVEGADTVAGDDYEPEGDLEEPLDNSAAAKIRRATDDKWRGRLTKVETAKDAEIERIRKELDDIKKQQTATAVPSDKPKRDDFASEDEYLEALTDYKISHVVQKNQSAQQESQRNEQNALRAAEIEKETDAHYMRVAALSKKNPKLNPDVCKAADMRVRLALDSVYPQGGDVVTDRLISTLGPGSENVIVHLGLKPSKLAHLVELFKKDTSGILGATYLGTLKAELKPPVPKVSNAPEPQDEIRGDNQRGTGMGGKMKKDWEAAHKSGDTQLAISIRRKAQNAKVDVSSWQ